MSNVVNFICSIRGLKALKMTYNLSKKLNKTEEEKNALKAFNKIIITSTLVISITVIIMIFITHWCLEKSPSNYFEGIVNSDKTISYVNNSSPPLKPEDINISKSELIKGKRVYIIIDENKNIIEISYEKPQNYIFILIFIYIIFSILMIIFVYILNNHKETKTWIIWYQSQNK